MSSPLDFSESAHLTDNEVYKCLQDLTRNL